MADATQTTACRPLKDIDVRGEDARAQIQAALDGYTSGLKGQFLHYRGQLPPGEREGFAAYIAAQQEKCRLEGAMVVLAREKKESGQIHHLEQQMANLQARLERVGRHNASLEERLRKRKGKAVPDPPRSDVREKARWDYPMHPDSRPEPLAECSPFGVSVTARTVEEYVTRLGITTKADVSAAFPHLKDLAAAYRNLHESKRIRVVGLTLTPWNGEERRG